MNRSLRMLCLCLMVGTLAAAPVLAESHTEKAKDTKTKTAAKAEVKTDAAHDAMMAEMEKYAMPGPGHEKLKGMAGKWKASTKAWFAPGEPTVTEGTSENTLALGGRYVRQEFKGSMMGQPFEGMGITGYDNKRQVYTTLWIDNMTTAMMTADGTMNEAGELVVKATMDGPDGKPMEHKMVTKFVDANKHVFSMYGVMEGKEQLLMEITYTRM